MLIYSFPEIEKLNVRQWKIILSIISIRYALISVLANWSITVTPLFDNILQRIDLIAKQGLCAFHSNPPEEGSDRMSDRVS